MRYGGRIRLLAGKLVYEASNPAEREDRPLPEMVEKLNGVLASLSGRSASDLSVAEMVMMASLCLNAQNYQAADLLTALENLELQADSRKEVW